MCEPPRSRHMQNDGYYALLDKVLKQLHEEVPDSKYDKKTLAQMLWTMQQFMEDCMGKTVSCSSGTPGPSAPPLPPPPAAPLHAGRPRAPSRAAPVVLNGAQGARAAPLGWRPPCALPPSVRPPPCRPCRPSRASSCPPTSSGTLRRTAPSSTSPSAATSGASS
jgi:hypothetical protein